jgi:DNA-binding response OmpR family regulator
MPSASREIVRSAILVVDDDAALREAVACGLGDTYMVHTAATGKDACACLSAHPIAAILLDVYLQDEDGLDLVPRLRALSPAPIVILTGRGSEEVAIRAVRARAVDYLRKPFTLTALQASVAQAIAPGILQPAPREALVRTHRHLAGSLTTPHTASSVAQAVGVSERQFRRVFRDARGHTPQRHLLLLRLRQAAELLHQSQLAIKEIAAAVGFQSFRTFTRAFARTFGTSPARFRRRGRHADPDAHSFRTPTACDPHGRE